VTAPGLIRYPAGNKESMIILGLILLILGLVLGSGILWIIGLVLIAVGAVLWLLGSMDRAVAGRRHYW
jgi:membrane protein implicated in regulation of membrane protease activity